MISQVGLLIASVAKMIFLLIFLVAYSSGDEIYQNSSNICSRCSCSDAQTFAIDCSNQNFVHMLASWPSSKPIKADFTGNNFTSLDKIPPTQSSVEITMSFCNIKSLDPAVFEEAPFTKYVDLSHNHLTSEELQPDRFRGAYQNNIPQPLGIEHLDLSYNEIHSLDKDVFKFLPRLKWLSVEGNDFKVLDIHTQMALSSLPELTSLNLAGNELMDLVPAAVEKLKLVTLDLSKNDLDFVPRSLGAVGATLEFLVVDENPIFEMVGETFANLTNLKEISANNLTRLKTVGARAFSNERLTSVHLCNNSALSDIDPEAFAGSSNLKKLFLSRNNLTTLPPTLTNWSSLAAFDLTNNPLICTCALYEIVEKLPRELTRNDGPTCIDSTMATLQVYSLTSDICKAKVERVIGRIRYQHISIPLVGLIVCLMVGMMAAVAMGYGRYRRFLRGGQEGYASQVIYSPLLNSRV